MLALGVPIARIVVTHFHPDHVGGADQVRRDRCAGAPGRVDYEQCEHVGEPALATADRGLVRGARRPEGDHRRPDRGRPAYGAFIRFARDPERLCEGDRVDGWEVIAVPGHADGHIAASRDGALVAGDHLLTRISPAVGLYPDSRPDPLADYLDSLRRTAEPAPRVVYPGHGDPIEDAAGRARELIEHHRERLDATEAALADEPRSGYEVSCAVFGAASSRPPGAARGRRDARTSSASPRRAARALAGGRGRGVAARLSRRGPWLYSPRQWTSSATWGPCAPENGA